MQFSAKGRRPTPKTECSKPGSELVRQKGFEPLAYCLEGSCSILLSYWRISALTLYAFSLHLSRGIFTGISTKLTFVEFCIKTTLI